MRAFSLVSYITNFIIYVIFFYVFFFFFQAEDGIRVWTVTGVQTCALPISSRVRSGRWRAWQTPPAAQPSQKAPCPRGGPPLPFAAAAARSRHARPCPARAAPAAAAAAAQAGHRRPTGHRACGPARHARRHRYGRRQAAAAWNAPAPAQSAPHRARPASTARPPWPARPRSAPRTVGNRQSDCPRPAAAAVPPARRTAPATAAAARAENWCGPATRYRRVEECVALECSKKTIAQRPGTPGGWWLQAKG